MPKAMENAGNGLEGDNQLKVKLMEFTSTYIMILEINTDKTSKKCQVQNASRIYNIYR